MAYLARIVEVESKFRKPSNEKFHIRDIPFSLFILVALVLYHGMNFLSDVFDKESQTARLCFVIASDEGTKQMLEENS